MGVLVEFNAIEDAKLLRIGQEIRIPPSGGQSSCPTSEELSYVTDAIVILDTVRTASEILERELDGAIPADRGRGEWSGLVTAALLDLWRASELFEEVDAPDHLLDLHEELRVFVASMEKRQEGAYEFVSASSDDSNAASGAIRDLANEASMLRSGLLAICVDRGGQLLSDPTDDADACPSESEEQYFAQVNRAFSDIDAELLDLLALNEEFAADVSLIRNVAWRTRPRTVGEAISSAADEIILLERPLDARYGVGLEIVYLAEDTKFAVNLYRLAIEQENPDLMIEAGEEFLALEPRFAAVAMSIEQYCN